MNKISCDTVLIMPTYNAALFIKDALESVLNQTAKDFKLVIADDASTDNTAEIIRALTANDERVIFLENKVNIGLNPNFNQIFDYIQTNINCNYIAFFAGDDLLNVKRLALQKEILDANLDADVCFSPAEILNHAGSYQLVSNIIGVPKSIHAFYPYDYLIKNVFPFMPNTAFFRANILGETRFTTDFSSDFVFLIDIMMLSKKNIAYINEPLMTYRRHAGGVTSNIKFITLFTGTVGFYWQLMKKYPDYTFALLISFIDKFFSGGSRFLKSKYRSAKMELLTRIKKKLVKNS